MFFPLLSVGVKAGPPRSTSRGDSSRQRPLLVLLRGVKHARRSEKDGKNTRHSTVYGSRLNRSERKKGDRDKTKGLAWNLYRREGRGSGSKQRDQGNTRQRQESPEPESRQWKKDLDLAAVRVLDGCCGPNQPPTAKNLIRCHNYTQWRSTSIERPTFDPRRRASVLQTPLFLLMGFMLTNVDWAGEEDLLATF